VSPNSRIKRQHFSIVCSSQKQEWRIKRSELEVQLEQKIEESFRVRKALESLKLKREEEAKALEWQLFLQKVQQDIDEPEVAPWEVADDLQEVVQSYLYNTSLEGVDLGYMSVDLGGNKTGKNIVGKMNEMDRTVLKSVFDSVIADQKKTQTTKKKGVMSELFQGGGFGLKGSMKSDKLNAQGTWSLKRDAVESWVRQEQIALRRKNPSYAKKMLAEKLQNRTKKSIPWEEVKRRVEMLQYAILKESQPQPRKTSYNATTDDTLRMPRRNLNVNDELAFNTQASKKGKDERNTYQDIWFDLFDPDEQFAELTATSTRFGLRSMSVKNKIKTMQHASEDMIQHANKWLKKEDKLPYESVKDFRKYVAEEFNKYKNEEEIDGLEDGAKQPSRLIEYMLNNVDTDKLDASYFGLLLVPQKEFIEGTMRRQGYDMEQIFLSPTDIEEDNYRWAELDYIAETDWRFTNPDLYARYQKKRDLDIQTLELIKRLERDTEILSLEAEISVQEFQAIMLDLGQCRVQDDVIIFEPGDWTNSRVLGTSDDLDEIVDVGSTLIFVLLMLYPFIPVSEALLFDPTWVEENFRLDNFMSFLSLPYNVAITVFQGLRFALANMNVGDINI